MIKLKDYDVRLLERVSNKLSLQIDIKEIDDEFYIKNDNLLSVIDELYDELCNYYDLQPDWRNFNEQKDTFVKFVEEQQNKSL